MSREHYNDTERLNALQELLDEGKYSGKCILRVSNYGRGFRLHETTGENAVACVREAIDNFMDKQNKASIVQ